VFVAEPAGLRDYRKPVLTETSLDNRQLNWFNQSNLRRSGREPHLWRSDRGNLVADQLPARGRFCPDDAGLELAAGGFAAVLPFQRDPIDRDRDIAAVNPDFHVWIRNNGVEAGSTRFQVGQTLRLGYNRAAGVDEGVIVRPNPFERGGILLGQGGAVLLNHLSHFLLGGFGVRSSCCLRETERRRGETDQAGEK